MKKGESNETFLNNLLEERILWEKTINCSENAIAFSALENIRGDYIIVGKDNDNIVLLKYSIDGELLIQKEINIGEYSCATDIIELNDNKYLITGYTKSTGILLFINDHAELILNKKYNSRSLLKIINDEEDYLIIGARTTPDKNSTNTLIMKVNGNGDILLEEVFDKYHLSVPREIKNDSNNNYIIIGYCRNEDTGKKTFIFRTDTSGNITDYKYLESYYTEHGFSIIKIEDRY